MSAIAGIPDVLRPLAVVLLAIACQAAELTPFTLDERSDDAVVGSYAATVEGVRLVLIAREEFAQRTADLAARHARELKKARITRAVVIITHGGGTRIGDHDLGRTSVPWAKFMRVNREVFAEQLGGEPDLGLCCWCNEPGQDHSDAAKLLRAKLTVVPLTIQTYETVEAVIGGISGLKPGINQIGGMKIRVFDQR